MGGARGPVRKTGPSVAALGGAVFGSALLFVAIARSGTPAAPATIRPLADDTSGFADAQPVAIVGYLGDAMEPFLPPDGRHLLFNDSNAPGRDTNLHVARRVDGLTFAYRGALAGANSTALDGVASVDRKGRLVFVSTRSYGTTLSTLYEGRFAAGRATRIKLLGGISRREPGWVNFDAEISADGATLYFVDGFFGAGAVPERADIVVARKVGSGFARLANSAELLAEVNSEALEYAPCTSADQRELFFTRLDAGGVPRILRATRQSRGEPFGPPELVAAAEGFVEAPTLSPDGTALYFHRLDDGVFRIFRATR